MILRPNRPFTCRQNHLLAALPAADYERLRPHLELAALPLGLALYESGSEQGYAYFPTTSIVSLLNVTQDGSSAEIAVVGQEGVVGIAPFLGGETTTSCAVVQSAGYAYRLRASVMKEEFHRGGPLQRLLLRYTQALITQMAQTAVCSRRHAVEQRLCRSLLSSLDRLPSNEVNTTQRLISSMLPLLATEIMMPMPNKIATPIKVHVVPILARTPNFQSAARTPPIRITKPTRYIPAHFMTNLPDG
jgi:CRP-like cAMP-binding protein